MQVLAVDEDPLECFLIWAAQNLKLIQINSIKNLQIPVFYLDMFCGSDDMTKSCRDSCVLIGNNCSWQKLKIFNVNLTDIEKISVTVVSC
jgi:hypothetical protein